MMKRKPLSAQGDIFIKKQTKRQPHRFMLFLLGMTTGLLGLLVVAGIQTTTQPSVVKSQTASPITPTPGIMRYFQNQTQDDSQISGKRNHDDDYDHNYDYSYRNRDTYSYNKPIYAAPQQTKPIQSDNLGDIVHQIHQEQNAVLGTMNECIKLTQNAKGQIDEMRAHEKEINDEINEISRRQSSINYNDPDSSERRRDLQEERDDLYAERTELQNIISQTRTQYNNARSNCQNTVSKQQQQKRDLEYQLQNAYSKMLNVTIY